MEPKEQPVDPAGLFVSLEEVKLWYKDNPLPPSKAEAAFPLYKSSQDTWGIISNESANNNEAADPISLDSTVPLSGREGFFKLMGGLSSFGKSRGMKSKDIREYNDLKRLIDSGQSNSPRDAENMLNMYGGDLAFCRTAMYAQMMSLDWSLLSNACSYALTAANSPYMQSIKGMDYPIEAWQKDNVAMSWANPLAEILTDIQSMIDLGVTKQKRFKKILINKTWALHVRNNKQIQLYCATLMSNLFNTQERPTISVVNAMLARHFEGEQIYFEVIEDTVTRKKADGTTVIGYPFADGVAVFVQSDVIGHFHWKDLSTDIADPSAEYAESFFIVGRETTQNPTSLTFYTKALGFPVVDTALDNVYLKVDAVAWS